MDPCILWDLSIRWDPWDLRGEGREPWALGDKASADTSDKGTVEVPVRMVDTGEDEVWVADNTG
ncbi:MAG: hypothetical protein ACO3ZW_10055 [Opitutales bacterium]